MKALLWLRFIILRRRLARLLGDASVYMSDGAWVTYLFVGGFFGGVLIDFLIHPERLSHEQMALSQLAVNSLLLVAPFVLFLLESTKGLEISPLLLTPGESRFLLIGPVPGSLVLGERLATLHLRRAAIGLVLGLVAWPFLHFLWPQLRPDHSMALGVLVALCSGAGASLGILLALLPPAARAWSLRARAIGGLLLLCGAFVAQTGVPHVTPFRSIAVAAGAKATAVPSLLTYPQATLWLLVLVLWAGAALVAWLAVRRTGMASLATRSAIWLKLRSLLRAGRKAEAHRFMRQAEAMNSAHNKAGQVLLYGSGVRAILFKQLTVLRRVGLDSWLSGWLVPCLLFVSLVFLSSAEALRSVPFLVGGASLILAVARWFRLGSRDDLANLYAIQLLPITLRQLLIAQLLLPAIGLFPLFILLALRISLLLGGVWWTALLLTGCGVAATALIAAVAMVEDWLGVQTPHSRDRLFISGVMAVLPFWLALQFGPVIGPLVFLVAATGLGAVLILWLRLEIGKAALGTHTQTASA